MARAEAIRVPHRGQRTTPPGSQVARIGVSLGANGDPAGLSVLDAKGQLHALLAMGREGGLVLSFFDESGHSLWKAP